MNHVALVNPERTSNTPAKRVIPDHWTMKDAARAEMNDRRREGWDRSTNWVGDWNRKLASPRTKAILAALTNTPMLNREIAEITGYTAEAVRTSMTTINKNGGAIGTPSPRARLKISLAWRRGDNWEKLCREWGVDVEDVRP